MSCLIPGESLVPARPNVVCGNQNKLLQPQPTAKAVVEQMVQVRSDELSMNMIDIERLINGQKLQHAQKRKQKEESEYGPSPVKTRKSGVDSMERAKIGEAITIACSNNYDDDAIHLVPAAEVLRKEILSREYSFGGSFEPNCEKENVLACSCQNGFKRIEYTASTGFTRCDNKDNPFTVSAFDVAMLKTDVVAPVTHMLVKIESTSLSASSEKEKES
ncbi:hypothetical protein ScPMuIL_003662 [Solemya velum]